MPILALIVLGLFVVWIILGKLPFSQKVIACAIPVIVMIIALMEVIDAYW